MTELYGVDISQWQGNINWDQLNSVANFVIIRVGDGTILDTEFTRNQSEARRVKAAAGPLGVGYYYFADPTLLDPITSANFFVNALGQLEEGEVLALDLEGKIGNAPVNWSLAWLRQVQDRTGVKPWIYLNQSEKSGYNWGPVVSEGFGLWEAQYSGDRTTAPNPTPWPVIAGRQWTDVDVVGGVPSKVDGDTFYGTFDQFNAYGYHVPVIAPPTPTPAPAPTSPPTPTEPVPIPVVVTPTPIPPVPAPNSSPPQSPSPSQEPSVISSFFNSVFGRFWLGALATIITPLIMYLQNFQTNNATLASFIVGAVAVLLFVKDLTNKDIPNLPWSSNSKS